MIDGATTNHEDTTTKRSAFKRVSKQNDQEKTGQAPAPVQPPQRPKTPVLAAHAQLSLMEGDYDGFISNLLQLLDNIDFTQLNDVGVHDAKMALKFIEISTRSDAPAQIQLDMDLERRIDVFFRFTPYFQSAAHHTSSNDRHSKIFAKMYNAWVDTHLPEFMALDDEGNRTLFAALKDNDGYNKTLANVCYHAAKKARAKQGEDSSTQAMLILKFYLSLTEDLIGDCDFSKNICVLYLEYLELLNIHNIELINQETGKEVDLCRSLHGNFMHLRHNCELPQTTCLIDAELVYHFLLDYKHNQKITSLRAALARIEQLPIIDSSQTMSRALNPVVTLTELKLIIIEILKHTLSTSPSEDRLQELHSTLGAILLRGGNTFADLELLRWKQVLPEDFEEAFEASYGEYEARFKRNAELLVDYTNQTKDAGITASQETKQGNEPTCKLTR